MTSQNLLKDPNTNWKYILIVVILAFLVGGGILYWLPKQEIEMPEIEIPERKVPEKVEVPADWKTYRNEEYGFELKYPVKYPEEIRINETSAFFLILPAIAVRVSVESQLLPNFEDGIFSEEITINNINFKKIYKIAYTGYAGLDTEYSIDVYTKKDNKYIIFSLHNFTSNLKRSSVEALDEMRDDKNEYVKIFNQILSTFRFLE